MQIAICDDEQLCIDRLSALVEAYCLGKRLNVELSVFTDPALFEKSNLSSYDVVFLDANMGEISGIELAKALRAVNNTAVLVYVSGFVEYAPMGYQVDAFRYLMKDTLEDVFDNRMDEIVGRLEMKSKQLLVATIGGDTRISIDRILYMESFRHQILFHLVGGAMVESKQHTMAELTEALTPHRFIRIHKSYLVNPEHIVTMKNKVATLDDYTELGCSKHEYPQTLRTFMLWKGGV